MISVFFYFRGILNMKTSTAIILVIFIIFALFLKRAFERIVQNEKDISDAKTEIKKIKDDYLTKQDFVMGMTEINKKLDRLIERIK